MHRVLLGLGSNIERERYLIAGLDALSALFGELQLSSVYDSAAIGFEGQPFLNMAIAVQTGLSPGELFRRLRHIEEEYGRLPGTAGSGPRQLDIDLLTHGELVGEVEGVELPRPEILYNAFVLCPLAELVPGDRHPVAGESYAALWRNFDRTSQQLARVDFSWRGRLISQAGPLP